MAATLPRNVTFSMARSPSAISGCTSTTSPIETVTALVQRQVAEEPEFVGSTQAQDRLIGLHGLARVLHAVGDVASERSANDVFFDLAFSESQLGLGDLLFLGGRGRDVGLGCLDTAWYDRISSSVTSRGSLRLRFSRIASSFSDSLSLSLGSLRGADGLQPRPSDVAA